MSELKEAFVGVLIFLTFLLGITGCFTIWNKLDLYKQNKDLESFNTCIQSNPPDFCQGVVYGEIILK